MNVIKGDAGPKGPRGDKGDKGANGKRGYEGHRGHRGDTGKRGECGEKGECGEVGEVGPIGPIGPIGPVGPASILDYAYFHGNVLQDVVVDGNVLFNNTGLNTANIVYLPSGDITLVNSGVYKITYYVQANQVANVALFLNNVILPESIYAATSSSINYGQCIIASASSNAVLNLKSILTSVFVINPIPVGVLFGINTSIVIEQIR